MRPEGSAGDGYRRSEYVNRMKPYKLAEGVPWRQKILIGFTKIT